MLSAPNDLVGSVTARVLAGILIVWAVAIPLSPSAASRPGWTAALAAPVYAAGAIVCHQRVDRSFSTSGRGWPVCARCSGIYLGAAVVLVALLASGRRRRLAPTSPRSWRAVFTVGLAPIGASWGLERLGLVAPSNGARAVTGAVLGAAVALALAALLAREDGRVEDLR